MSENGQSLIIQALTVAVEARTLAQQAHERQDKTDEALTTIFATLSDLRNDVTRLSTMVAVAASAGSLLGGAIVAGVLKFV